MKVKEILRRLRRDGWFIVRQRGSHRHLQHPTKPGTLTVAGKPSETLHPKIVKSTLAQAQLQDD